MKRFISSILVTIILINSVIGFTGCGVEQVHILTRGEWIQGIADVFRFEESYSSDPYFSDVQPDSEYFTAVQACREWEIIDLGGKFNPDKRADVNFAIVTAIKAIGLDRIERSVDGKKLETEKEIINYFNDHSSIKYIPGSNLYMDTAESILSDLMNMYTSIEYEKNQDIKLGENVVAVTEDDIAFSMDGKTATINKTNVKVGDILVLEPNEIYPRGVYAKVTAIQGDTITYEEPTLEETFDHITLCGTYTPEILGVIPLTEGITVTRIEGTEAKTQNYYNGVGFDNLMYVQSGKTIQTANSADLGDIEFYIEPDLPGNVDIKGTLELKDMAVTADIDMWGPVVNKAEVGVDTTIESGIEFSAGGNELETSIPIAKIPCKVFGVVGVDFVLSLKFGIEGSITVEFSVDTSAGVTYRPFRLPKYSANASNPSLDLEIKAKAFVTPEVKVDFVLGPWAVASIGITSGFEAFASWTVNVVGESEENCIDIRAYIPLTIYVGAEREETLLGKLGVKKKWEIWDENNSPIHKGWHIEEFEIVPECTKKNDKNDSEDSVVEDSYNTDSTVDEYFNDVETWGTGIEITAYYAVLGEGNSDVIGVEKIPNGYTKDDIVFTTSNSNVAIVDSNGKVTGVGQGTCMIAVSTSDGRYIQVCALTVLASYDVEFTPLRYMVL